MGIEVGFTIDTIRKRYDNFLKIVQEEQIKTLQYLGEMCVKHARLVPKNQGFEDQTGNLRSSIGYAVFVDGTAVHSTYEPHSVEFGIRKVKRKRKLKDGTIKEYEAEIKVGGDGTIGAKTGEALAMKVGEQTEGICLVVTAGMNYAVHVESNGRDVITSAEQLAKRELPKMTAQLTKDIYEMAKSYKQ